MGLGPFSLALPCTIEKKIVNCFPLNACPLMNKFEEEKIVGGKFLVYLSIRGFSLLIREDSLKLR